MNPFSINQHFIRIGYKGMRTAHRLRRTELTAGQDVLRLPAEVIQRQMAHAVGDKRSVRHTTIQQCLMNVENSWSSGLMH